MTPARIAVDRGTFNLRLRALDGDGRVRPGTSAAWHGGGASGMGVGSALYRPGDDAATVARRAAAIVAHHDEVCCG